MHYLFTFSYTNRITADMHMPNGDEFSLETDGGKEVKEIELLKRLLI